MTFPPYIVIVYKIYYFYQERHYIFQTTKKYDLTYVDIHDMFLANDNYLPKKLEIHPTTLGYKAMAKSVISLIDKKTLAK